jgi:mannose-6-phosphate isomerase-like protein (cupin superfamily)
MRPHSPSAAAADDGPRDVADTVAIGGFTTRYLAAGAGEDGGAYALVEHELGPGLLGAPPHRHSREDECSYVLEGTLTVWRDGAVTSMGAGGVVAKPRGEWHTFWNAGSVPVRFLEVIAPAAFAEYFRELEPLIGAAAAAGQRPDPGAIAALAARYGMEFDFPAMGRLLGEHGLRLE